jgi:hypothetical protein
LQILRIASALLLCHNITDRLHGSLLLFEATYLVATLHLLTLLLD